MNSYTLREIPSDLHNSWKAAAALQGISMKDYCFVALHNQVAKDMREIGKSMKEEKDGSQKNKS